MPDFERVVDQLRLDLAKTPEEKARAVGYIEGKRYARKEIAILTAFVVALCSLGWLINF